MNGATKDYDFPQKDHWRRWLWNRISERLRMPKRDARVIGLFGSQLLDFQEAERRGFDLRKFIAIESDEEAAKKIRAAGVTTVVGDAFDALQAVPRGYANAVLLDFCGPMTDRNIQSVALALSNGGVVATNMLRGREFKQSLFSVADDANKWAAAEAGAKKSDIALVRSVLMHRGRLSMWIALGWMLYAAYGHERTEKILHDFIMLANPLIACASYRSGTQWFDSAVTVGCGGHDVFGYAPCGPLLNHFRAAMAVATRRSA